MPVEAGSSPSSIQYSNIDLQLGILRNLPTPILVLSADRTAVFTNQAAAELLVQADPIRSSSHDIYGRSPSDLGINLLHNRFWDVVLDKLLAAQSVVSKGEITNIVYELDVVVESHILSYDERYFRIFASAMRGDDGPHYVLSFERAAHLEKSPILASGDNLLVPEGDERNPVKTNRNAVGDEAADKLRDISRLKSAVFDSCNVAGFVLTADENFYLTNKKTREVLGDVMGGADGCDGPSLRARAEIWDETFSRRLEPSEFPGMKLLRTRHQFTNYRCGFTHSVTGDRIVMGVSGELLYDSDTGELVGGICWCHDLEEYSDFTNRQMQNRLQSHQTICNSMPNIVWTALPDGTCDWFSRRVGSWPLDNLGTNQDTVV